VADGTIPLTHVVIVRDGTLGTLYLNGIVKASFVSPLSDPINIGNFDFKVGYNFRDNNCYFNGKISNFIIYQNSVLSAAAVSTVS
jgi:hypothetical protein